MFNKMKSNLKKFFLIIFAILLILGFCIFKVLSPKNKIVVPEVTTTTIAKSEPKQNMLDDNFYSNILLAGKGDKKTERYVTILSDYGCPWSSKFYFNTISEFLKSKDIKKVWLQYDFLVLDEKSPSLLPTEGAYCANEYGRFWEFHDAIFGLKDKYEKATDAFTRNNIDKIANDLGINGDQFKQCLSEHKYKELILMRASYYLDSIDNLGVPATFLNGKPVTLFIEGKDQIVGAIDLTTFNQKITEWLKTN